MHADHCPDHLATVSIDHDLTAVRCGTCGEVEGLELGHWYRASTHDLAEWDMEADGDL